jgi:hypothetical protein
MLQVRAKRFQLERIPHSELVHAVGFRRPGREAVCVEGVLFAGILFVTLLSVKNSTLFLPSTISISLFFSGK